MISQLQEVTPHVVFVWLPYPEEVNLLEAAASLGEKLKKKKKKKQMGEET